jgi:hypothetical protein
VESPTYTLSLSEADRQMLVWCMGLMIPNLRHETIRLLNPDEFMNLAQRLQTAKPDQRAINAASGTDHARAILAPPPAQVPAVASKPAPIAARDRWARDRKGNELPNPDGCTSGEVNIWKVEQKPPKRANGKPYMKVTWQSKERGYVDANCFDSQLFPWLIGQQGKPTVLYLVRSGEYLNVVGVRA